MSVPKVTLVVDGVVATLTLDDQPKKNAMTEALGDELLRAVDQVRSMSEVRAVVLTGAGDTFSAGGDLAMLERLRAVPFEEARLHMRAFYARYLSLLRIEVPTIAAVRGAAIGAGLCVAVACDLCIVDEDAKLAFNFVGLGLHPGMGATHFLSRRIGPQRAAELLFSGRRFDGREAERLGIAVAALPAAAVLPRALALAADIGRQAPLAVRDLKRSLAVDEDRLEAALDREAECQARSYGSADLGEGIAAARERRPPRFSGA